MIGIVDYGVGNLFSLRCSLEAIGQTALVTADPAKLAEADRIILPGVGAFGDAAARLETTGLGAFLKQQATVGKPLMGICLGMQLLFEGSREFGYHRGLGLLPGEVRPIADRIPAHQKIPHMGWNALYFPGKKHFLFKSLSEGDFVYFVHSFHAETLGDCCIATTDYGAPLTAAAAKGNVMGCQFHPEKSGSVGLSILRAFCEGGGVQ